MRTVGLKELLSEKIITLENNKIRFNDDVTDLSNFDIVFSEISIEEIDFNCVTELWSLNIMYCHKLKIIYFRQVKTIYDLLQIYQSDLSDGIKFDNNQVTMTDNIRINHTNMKTIDFSSFIFNSNTSKVTFNDNLSLTSISLGNGYILALHFFNLPALKQIKFGNFIINTFVIDETLKEKKIMLFGKCQIENEMLIYKNNRPYGFRSDAIKIEGPFKI